MQGAKSYSSLKFVRFKDIEKWSTYSLIESNILFNDKYPLKSISKFLKRNKTKIDIEDDRIYKRPTVQLYGNGVKVRDKVYGKDIGTKKQFLIKEGQFIISRIDARNGAFGIAGPELNNSIATSDFPVFEINKNEIIAEYFELITHTEHFRDICRNESSGTTGRQRIKEKDFLNNKVPLPSLEEQEKIVSRYKEVVAKANEATKKAINLEKEIEEYINSTLGIEIKKREIKKGLQFASFKDIEDWSVDSIIGKKEVLRNKGYDIKKIGELCKIGSGGTPSRKKEEFYKNGSIPWLKTGEIREEIIYDTEEKITKIGLKQSSAKLYPKDSLVIAMYGATAGRSAKLGIEASTNQACAVLHQIDKSVVNTDFLWIYIQNEMKNIKDLASGSAQPNLNAEKISNYEVVLPPLDTQDLIVEKVNNMRVEIENQTKASASFHLEAIEEFKKTIFNL
ncbi:restriction endonuclease subunit S [Halobacillus mangrovi]|uniref:restriction endonuclease subunit S n=1 Tax=Halobacillus mangrovi TaxID=402384 RepID=UPI003D96DE93